MKHEEEEARRACEIVGELVLIASALDHQLNHICISVLSLVESPLLESVVASIDSARKIEILKAYAGKITAQEWKKAIKAHAEAVEEVNRLRNTAAHSVLSFRNGKSVLSSPSAVKLLKSIDIATRTAELVSLDKLAAAIKKGEAAHASGVKVLENFQRVAAERKKRFPAKK